MNMKTIRMLAAVCSLMLAAASVASATEEEMEQPVVDGCAFYLRTIKAESVTLEACRKMRKTMAASGDKKDQLMSCVLTGGTMWSLNQGYREPQLLPQEVRNNLMTSCGMFVFGRTRDQAEAITRKVTR
jgi:hypothetical protein